MIQRAPQPKKRALPGSERVTGCCSFYLGHVGMAGGVSGRVEPCPWDHDPRRGRACHFDKPVLSFVEGLSAQPEPAEACPEPSLS